jgi:hypothetical protein
MRGCISETEILEFLDGRLAADAVAALEEHVDRCGACRRLLAFLAQPFEASAALRPTMPRENAGGPTFSAGELVAERHRIVGFIAEGGMGEVYEAEDTILGERVALKTVGAALSDDPGLAERLKREVQLARRVTHPNVCRIFDVGVHARASGERMFFMTMELLAGETLGRRLRRAGPFALRDALPIIEQVAAALDAAHDAGIIHRDLKAENVFLASQARGRAVVTDFGLAEMHASREAREQPLIERETLVGGTPHYMAPEQALGQRVTGAADIYAFGVLIYEIVTGTLPFPAGATPFSIVAKRLKFEPVPPETHVPGLPARWSRAILRCLARDPGRRFARASEVAAALRPARGGLVALGAAGITVASVALVLGGRHAATPAPCPPLETSGDVWVDASATRAGSGARACPFRTVTDALAAVEGSRVHHTIHVAAGTYDQVLGERFPLVVRGDLAIHGAGDERTFVVGTGRYAAAEQGASVDDRNATFVIGDATAPTELANLAVTSGESEPERVRDGIVCDRGNGGRLDEDARPASTHLVDVTVGPNYGVAIVVAQSGDLGGCNLALRHGRVRRSEWGMWTVGCGARWVPPVAVAATIEDSTFTDMHAADEPGGGGICAWDCTDRLSVAGTHFASSDNGILFVRHVPGRHGLIVTGSSFGLLTRVGIGLLRAAHAERLEDNTIMAVSAGAVSVSGRRGVGLLIDQQQRDFRSPGVLLARRNAITGNDIGIEVLGATPFIGALDFGRPDDPGHNTIRCNATEHGSQAPGHDVELRAPLLATPPLGFAGNLWDHAPPTTGATNGADVFAEPWTQALDTSGATAAATACSRGGP